MTGKPARVLLQALSMTVFMAAALAQGAKNSKTIAQPSPSPSLSPAGGAKTTLSERKAGGDQGIVVCGTKPGNANTRKAGGNVGVIPCVKPAETLMRKAGGEQQALCTNEHGKAAASTGGDRSRKAGLNGDGKSALNGDGKPAEIEMRKAGGDPKASGKTAMEEFHRKSDDAIRPKRKAGGQGIVRPNCSSATKKAISGSTGGAAKPDVPQTQVPK
jgi:hypothetical protein